MASASVPAAARQPICLRFRTAPVCGCTIPCRRSVPENPPVAVVPPPPDAEDDAGAVNRSGEREPARGTVFIGALQAALDEERLRKAGISLVVDASGQRYEDQDGIEYFRLDIEDVPSSAPELRRAFSPVTDLTHQRIERGESVLIHCSAGVSRSATLVLAYVLRFRVELCGVDVAEGEHGDDVERALRYLQRLHPRAGPNEGFMRALRDWQTELSS
jgi:Dual specificity phosphatase, catalytic domain